MILITSPKTLASYLCAVIKKLNALFLSLILAWQLFLPVPVMIDYGLRYQEYSEQLCENRFDSQSTCHGSCQISRILQGKLQTDLAPQIPSFNLMPDFFWSAFQLAIHGLPTEFQPTSFISLNYERIYLSVPENPPRNCVFEPKS